MLRKMFVYAVLVVLSCAFLLPELQAFSVPLVRTSTAITGSSSRGRQMVMDIKNDASARANREVRRASATDRVVELKKPMGMELDEDKDGNVFVKSIEKGGRADKSGLVFEGDYVTMVSATFGDDLWTCRNVGLTRVLSCIKVRNTKPVKLVLEAATEEEEKKRRAIAYAPPSPQQVEAKRVVSQLMYDY